MPQRVNYDRIAHLYDEPGRDHSLDPRLVSFLKEKQSRSVRILDLGCGTGKQLAADRHVYPDLFMAGLDLFHGMLAQAKQRSNRVQWIQGDSAHPPFSSKSFDYITNQYSYHHMQDKDSFFASVYRILKPGGQFVMTNIDPWSMTGWAIYRYFPPAKDRDFVDALPVSEFVRKLESVGFDTIQVERQVQKSKETLGELLAYASRRYRTSQLIALTDTDYQFYLQALQEAVQQQGSETTIDSEICRIWVSARKP